MIYKYPLELTDEQTIQLPKGAQILSVQVQHDQFLCLWALVDSNVKETANHLIYVIGTGHPHPPASSMRFIDTVQMNGGDLVWHIFERPDLVWFGSVNK